MLLLFIGMMLLAALTPGLAVLLVETAVLIGYALATISARSAIARPPFMRRVLDAITGGFFISIGFLLGTKSADA